MEDDATKRFRNSLEYAVIGRLNRDHDAYSLSPEHLKGHIVDFLEIHVDAEDIHYIAPNYIIDLPNAHAQGALLAAHPLLHGNHFLLEILPWSQEHEWCQVPWISEYAPHNSFITIDPLSILPIVTQKTKESGTNKLKDSFAAKIPRAYDLKAPDYSYLVITELRNFYNKKAELFTTYKNNFVLMEDLSTKFMATFCSELAKLYSALHILQDSSSLNVRNATNTFISDIKAYAHAVELALLNMKNATSCIMEDIEPPLDLSAYRDIPPTSEFDVPVGYSRRLKKIMDVVIERLHNTRPIIETVKREENRFETYITISNFTRRYYGAHQKSAEATEATAIFYALKHISNVRGYNIIDLNYPVMKKMVKHLDKWNEQINMLEVLPQFFLRKIQHLHNQLEEAKQKLNITISDAFTMSQIIYNMTQLLDSIEDCSIQTKDLIAKSSGEKATYFATKIGTYSPSRSYYRFGRAKRPAKHELI